LPEPWWPAANGSLTGTARGATIAGPVRNLTPGVRSRLLVPPPADAPAGPAITAAETHPALCLPDAAAIAVRSTGTQIISAPRRLRPGLLTGLVR
jgi:hypothetical protein